jgi:hypothetical protein
MVQIDIAESPHLNTTSRLARDVERYVATITLSITLLNGRNEARSRETYFLEAADDVLNLAAHQYLR